MRRLILALCGLISVAVFTASGAHADVGGSVPGPDLCDYPGVGQAGAETGAYHYTCSFPMEENGSHWQCDYGGGMVTGVAGVSFFMLNAGITMPLGALEGACAFRCPDGALSAPPNPPGAWRNYLAARPCKPVQAQPVSQGAPDAADPGLMPAVTNPVAPNPLSTQNETPGNY